MKAAVISKWGDPTIFEQTDIPIPIPAPDQIMIKVVASSINPVDWKHRIGNHKYILGSPFPIVLGYDVCGEVVEVGNNTSHFKKGDMVFGDLDNKYGGGLAEFAVGHEHCFALKPKNIDASTAAAIPLAGMTALQALRDKCSLKPGQTILINGASGGVGHFAIQIAKIMGAKVMAVCSKEKHAFAHSLGADECIDYKSEDLSTRKNSTDIFFDVIGNYSFLSTRNMLHKNGIYISTLPRPKILIHKLLQPFSNGKKVKTLLRKHVSADLTQLAQWVDDDKLKVHIDKSFKLNDITKAHTYAETGRTTGKNIVVIQ